MAKAKDGGTDGIQVFHWEQGNEAAQAAALKAVEDFIAQGGKAIATMRPRGRLPEAPATEPGPTLKQRAGLAVLTAFITRHGGYSDVEMDSHLRLVWKYAELFVALEDAPPPKPDIEATRPRGRPVHPADEWGLRLQDGTIKRGIATREGADDLALVHAGSEVVQLGGPEVNAAVTAT